MRLAPGSVLLALACAPVAVSDRGALPSEGVDTAPAEPGSPHSDAAHSDAGPSDPFETDQWVDCTDDETEDTEPSAWDGESFDTDEPWYCRGELEQLDLVDPPPVYADVSTLAGWEQWLCASDAAMATSCPPAPTACASADGLTYTFVAVDVSPVVLQVAFYDGAGALAAYFIVSRYHAFCDAQSRALWLGADLGGACRDLAGAFVGVSPCGVPLACGSVP